MKDPWFWVDVALTLLPGAGKLLKHVAKAAFKAYKAYRNARRAGACRLILWCFIAGTAVWTANGLKNIEDVEAGEQVWSYDAQTDEWRLCEVIAPIVTDYLGDMAAVEFILETDERPPPGKGGLHAVESARAAGPART